MNDLLASVKSSIKKTKVSARGLSKITETLYLSGCGAITKESLENAEITNVINMSVELENFTYPDEENLTIYRAKLRDSPDENILSCMDRCLDIIHTTSQNGGKTLVHCIAGVSRSATVCIAYMVKFENMSLRAAYEHVYERRDVIFPNKGFWKALIQFEEEIRGTTSVEMRPYLTGVDPDVYFPFIKMRLVGGWYDELITFWALHITILLIQIFGIFIF